MRLTRFKDVINAFAKKVLKDAKKSAAKKGWGLAKKLKANSKLNENSFQLQFEPGYAKWVDEGVSGVDKKRATPNKFKRKGGKGSFKGMPPTAAFDTWALKKLGALKRNKKGQIQSRKSLKFAIAVSVWKKGIRRSLFFTRPFKKYYKELNNDLLDVFNREVESLLDQTFKDAVSTDDKKAAKKAAKFN